LLNRLLEPEEDRLHMEHLTMEQYYDIHYDEGQSAGDDDESE
jgi:hypothetical protein